MESLTSPDYSIQEAAAISQINDAYQQLTHKYQDADPQSVPQLIRSLVTDEEAFIAFHLAVTKNLYRNFPPTTIKPLSPHRLQKVLPHPFLPLNAVDTCVLTTIVNVLLYSKRYNPATDNEGTFLSQCQPEEIFDDGTLLHVEPTRRILSAHGLHVNPTNNAVEVIQCLRKGGSVSLNQDNHHVVLISGLDITPSAITFSINDSSEPHPKQHSLEEVVRSLSDWRFHAAVTIHP